MEGDEKTFDTSGLCFGNRSDPLSDLIQPTSSLVAHCALWMRSQRVSVASDFFEFFFWVLGSSVSLKSTSAQKGRDSTTLGRLGIVAFGEEPDAGSFTRRLWSSKS